MPTVPEPALSVVGNMQVDVDGVSGRLVADGSQLTLTVDNAAGVVSGAGLGAGALGPLADGLAASGLRLDIVGARGTVLSAGHGVHSRFARLFTGSAATHLGSPRAVAPLVRARLPLRVLATAAAVATLVLGRHLWVGRWHRER